MSPDTSFNSAQYPAGGVGQSESNNAAMSGVTQHQDRESSSEEQNLEEILNNALKDRTIKHLNKQQSSTTCTYKSREMEFEPLRMKRKYKKRKSKQMEKENNQKDLRRLNCCALGGESESGGSVPFFGGIDHWQW